MLYTNIYLSSLYYVLAVCDQLCALLSLARRFVSRSPPILPAPKSTVRLPSMPTVAAATLGLAKVGVLVFYRRIFVVDQRSLRDIRNLIMIVMIVLTTLWSLAFCLALMWMCKGDFQAAFQSPAIAAAKCVDAPLLGYAFSVSDFVSDVLIILLPLPFVSTPL